MTDSVLVIDDDPGAIRLLGRILSGSNDLRFATNGEDGLRLARESAPDLILLDAEMPGMSGFQVCELPRFPSSIESLQFNDAANALDEVVASF